MLKIFKTNFLRIFLVCMLRVSFLFINYQQNKKKEPPTCTGNKPSHHPQQLIMSSNHGDIALSSTLQSSLRQVFPVTTTTPRNILGPIMTSTN